MKLYHATRSKHLPAILRDGLLCSKSQGEREVVWATTASNVNWACNHVVMRHRGRIEDVVVIEIDVPRDWLRKHNGRLWYSVRDIPPSRIGTIRGFSLIARAK